MSDDKMPERWEMPISCDYRYAANGDWVRAEDVEPLVAENARLRARVEVLELIRRYLGQGVSWDRAEEKAIDEIEERKARAALEAKP